MGKSTGFLEYERKTGPVSAPGERIKNFRDFHGTLSEEQQRLQGARCMECGVPFCQAGVMIAGMASAILSINFLRLAIRLILAVGSIMSLGFEKVYLMQNPVNMQFSEIISTFVYKRGLINFQYSYATAVGLFNSVCNLVLIVLANMFSKKVNETSLW